MKGFSLNEEAGEGYPFPQKVIVPLLAQILRKRLQIGTDMLLIIASTSHGFFKFINIDDLQRP